MKKFELIFSTIIIIILLLSSCKKFSKDESNFSEKVIESKSNFSEEVIENNINKSPSDCVKDWMKRNLDVTTYRNGDPIPQVTDRKIWIGLNTGAWCYNNNDPANGKIYGKLYNWYAVNDPRGLAPKGWHVPSDEEWKELEMCLGMSRFLADSIDGTRRGIDEGGKLKEAGTRHWRSPNEGATNESGFTGLPGGTRDGHFGYFSSIGELGCFWTSTEHHTRYNSLCSYTRILFYSDPYISRESSFCNKKDGYYVRCVKD
jgi:uncharacterized protein (TIGR02145 family)